MSRFRSLAVAALLLAPASSSPSRVSAPAAPRAVPRYRPPLSQPLLVVTPFTPPATPYGPGHRGVDLRAAPGAPVRAAGPGVVTFAGPVAGRGVVVVAHPDGVSTEYEPLDPAVRTGARVAAGETIGVVRGRHPGCPTSCLHWGARRAGRYLAPLDLLRPLGPVVLLPSRPPPPRRAQARG